MTRQRARRLAVMVIFATEGAGALRRAERSLEPFEDVATVLESLAETADPVSGQQTAPEC